MSQIAPSHQATPHTRRSVVSSSGNTLLTYLRHLLVTQRRSTIIWALALTGYAAVIVAAFPSTKDSTDISSYPQSMRDALQITSLDTIEPYLTAQVMSYLPLVVAFIPIAMFAAAIAGAEERGSLDILLGTPLPRRHLVIATFITGAVKLAVVLGCLAVGLWLTSLAVDAGLPFFDALVGSAAAWPTAMVPGAIALLASAAWRQRGKVQGGAIGAMIVMYAADILSRLVDSLDWLKYLSAFHYYGSAIEHGIWWGGAALQLGVIAFLVAAAVWLFDRRDVYA